MDLRRYLDLYTAEAQEHVQLLQRSLLALEQEGAGPALDAAFRAAHTLKGISAAMGYDTVASLAHSLEDRLAALRGAPAAADAVDALLAEADAVEQAVRLAIAGGVPVTGPAAATTSPAAVPAEPVPVPDGVATVVTVRLQPDTPLPAVRAMLVVHALDGAAGVIGTHPASFDDTFDGVLHIFLAAAADADAVRATVDRAGDIESVEVRPVAAPAAFVTPATPAASGMQPNAGAAAAQPALVRVDAGRVDDVADGVAELSVLFNRLQLPEPGSAEAELVDRMRVVLGNVQHDVLQLRMARVALAFERLPRVVRDAARSVDRDVELVMSGEEVELDRAIIDEIGEPLVHLLRNAVDHGIEDAAGRAAAGKPPRGRITLRAERERGSVRITVSDDGGGVQAARVVERARAAGVPAADTPGDEELFRLLSHPGLSTAGRVTSVSGRGVGLDVVVSRIRALGGAIGMQTVPGRGTTFTLRLPITLALAHALHVRVRDEDYVIPLTHITEVVDLEAHAAGEAVVLRGESLRLVRLDRVLQVPGTAHGQYGTAIIAGIGERRAALAVDELVGREQILVKSFDAANGTLPYFSGATLLGDGRPALVLDPLSVI